MYPLAGNIILCFLKITKKLDKTRSNPAADQNQALTRLLVKGGDTAFGKHHHFQTIIEGKNTTAGFKKNVPLHNYSAMLEKWWHRSLAGEANVTWPGKIKYFALSSGTSDAASKYIPVSADMLKWNKKTALSQVRSLVNFQIPARAYTKGVLMLGGSSSLKAMNGYYVGDMSGISTLHMPRWISDFFFKPGQKIAREPEWQKRIDLIVQNAHHWDIGIICGIPSWVQIVIEKIIDNYNLNSIHDIWPNLSVYIHGGVSFDHYRDNFKKLFGKPITYIETYMASEGSFGFKEHPGDKGMRLILDGGIFYEFIEFNAQNFDDHGRVLGNPATRTVNEVQPDIPYAVVISTCAGAWRYLIGDVVKFTNVESAHILVVGRTSQFLNTCGEHVSIDNITQAVEITSKKLQLSIGEFSVAATRSDNLFAYRWFVGCDDQGVDSGQLKKCLDQALCTINDDYRVERQAGAIREVIVEVLPKSVFHGYLKWLRKDDAMAKFPRVMKGSSLASWENYLSESTEFREVKRVEKKL